MLLKDLKKWVNSLTEEELKTKLMYVSDEFNISGFVNAPVKAKQNLYYTHEDDPDTLYTKKQIIENEMLEPGEFEELYDSPEVSKGSYYIKF